MTNTEVNKCIELHKSIKRCREHSKEKCRALQKELRARFPANSNDTVLVCGSYGRREAEALSDVDYYLVIDEKDEREEHPIEDIKKVVQELGLKAPSLGGSFARKVTRQSIIQNIGGANDSNHNMTHRMLLLLEGYWLFNKKGFRDLRRKILCQYLRADIPDHQVALFLLNDIIRYWRTICVDYEYKTTAEEKPWAIRNVKLVFSRKLLYASGLFSVALTADMSMERKVERLEELFDLCPLDRVVHNLRYTDDKRDATLLRCFS